MSQFWERQGVAARYSASRPYFHPLVVERIKDRLDGNFASVLDIACGTGLSTVALLDISDEVYGTDLSGEMLALAPRRDAIEYIEAPAEDIAFEDDHFDLLTVSSGLHWFDRERFLAEAARVLEPEGWLAVYDNWFTGRMSENPEYEVWFRDEYLSWYPSPSRNKEPLTEEALGAYGFELSGEELFDNEVRFSVDELSNYLMTQSNTIAAVRGGKVNEEELRRRLVEEQAPLFRDSTGTFEFEGEIFFIQRRRM